MFYIFSVVVTWLAIWIYFKWKYSYWKKKGVPYYKPTIPFGNALSIAISQMNPGIFLKEAYLKIKKDGHVHVGSYLFAMPRYIPIDIKIIKCILQNDFNYFTERGFYYNEKDDPLSANLFSLGGDRWKTLRSKLSPAFSIAKLKLMLDPLLECADGLKDAIIEVEDKNGIVDATSYARNYSINVIALCAFGIKCNCFKNPNSEFITYGLSIFDHSSLLRRLKMCVAFTFPNLALFLGIRAFGDDHTTFFTNIVKETISFREKHNIMRKDLIQLLLDLKKGLRTDLNEEERKQWLKGATIDEMAAQVFIFFSAGFETTSTTLYLCLYELSLNLSIQTKVRQEIRTILTKYKSGITYEALCEMNYTNQVLEETLRKYPPVSFIGRKCVHDYKIPDTSIILHKDTYIDIPILGIHHDPEFYPDPDKFDPDRFSETNKIFRLACTYMPFGEGPRTCIGLRFAMMVLKVGLTVILQQYEISLNEGTQVPLEFNPISFTLSPKQNIFLNIRKLCN